MWIRTTSPLSSRWGCRGRKSEGGGQPSAQTLPTLLCADANVPAFCCCFFEGALPRTHAYAAAHQLGLCRSRPGARRRNVLTPEAEAKLGQANLQYAVNKCASLPSRYTLPVRLGRVICQTGARLCSPPSVLTGNFTQAYAVAVCAS